MNLFLTLDYELYMSSSTGTVSKCLIEPMKHLTTLLNVYNIKAVVFVDAAYLLRLNLLHKEHKQLAMDYTAIINNIQQLISEGHDIELHFHPQWLYSEYDEINNKWIMDFYHYKLSDMEPSFANKSFKEAKDLLDSIVGYKTIAFRAGGFSLNSFDNYQKLLMDNGIIIDSSVHAYKKEIGRFQAYDYKHIPKKSSWFFSENVCQESYNGSIKEYPITSTHRIPSLLYLIRKKMISRKVSHEKKWGDGLSIDSEYNLYEKLCRYIKKLIKGVSISACIDGNSIFNLRPLYLNAKKNNFEDMVIIGHPKAISPISILQLKDFIETLDKNDKFSTFRK